MLIKQESITSQKLGSHDFWQIANSVLNKGKSAIPPRFNGPEVLSSASDKAKLFAENFSKNSNLDDSGISLPVFPSRTNLKLKISVSSKMVKKVIMNLDLSKACGPDCIPVVVLKNCDVELSYILAELFNKCLKESCFPDCWKVSSVVLVFKNLGMLVFSTNLSLIEFEARYLALFLLLSVIDGFEWFWMESLHKNIQLMQEFLKAPFLVLHFSCYTLMTFLTMLSVILLSMLMILLFILSVTRDLICGNNLNWLVNLASGFEALWTGVRNDLLISMLGKLSWFRLTGLITVVLLM